MQQGGLASLSVILLGVLIALGLFACGSRIADSNDRVALVLQNKVFSSPTYSTNNLSEGVITLSGERFAVVQNGHIMVYRVAADGKLVCTDNVDTLDDPRARRILWKDAQPPRAYAYPPSATRTAR